MKLNKLWFYAKRGLLGLLVAFGLGVIYFIYAFLAALFPAPLSYVFLVLLIPIYLVASGWMITFVANTIKK